MAGNDQVVEVERRGEVDAWVFRDLLNRRRVRVAQTPSAC
jgi:hypothetical protein